MLPIASVVTHDWLVSLMFLASPAGAWLADQWVNIVGTAIAVLIGKPALALGGRLLWAISKRAVLAPWNAAKAVGGYCFARKPLSRGCQLALEALGDADAVIGPEISLHDKRPTGRQELACSGLTATLNGDCTLLLTVRVGETNLLDVLDPHECRLLKTSALECVARTRERDRLAAIDAAADRMAVASVRINVLGNHANQAKRA